MCKLRYHCKDDAKDLLSKDYLKFVNSPEVLALMKADAQKEKRYA
jgi:hypothetical protein